MGKHIFWGIVVVLLGVLAAYVTLTLTGHSKEANDLASGIAGLVGGLAFLGFMYFIIALM